MHNCETIYSIRTRLLSIWECKYVILLMMKTIHFYMKFVAGYIVCTLIWLIWDTIFPKKNLSAIHTFPKAYFRNENSKLLKRVQIDIEVHYFLLTIYLLLSLYYIVRTMLGIPGAVSEILALCANSQFCRLKNRTFLTTLKIFRSSLRKWNKIIRIF